MVPFRALWPALLLIVASFAGCASDSTGGATLDDEYLDAEYTDGEEPAADPGTGGAEEAADDSGTPWYVYDFERTVTPTSGGSGRIQSFSYTHTKEDYEGVLQMEVDIELLGVSTLPIRTKKMTMESMMGGAEPEIVEVPVEVQKLRHVITVVQDDSGDHQAGDTTTVVAYIPTNDTAATESTFLWHFAKLEYESPDGASGGWEYFTTPEMEAQSEDGSVYWLPYEHGQESTGWWGFDFLLQTYSLSFFSGYVDGQQEFEEGSWSYFGYRHDVQRETLSVGGYAFDGWKVLMAAQNSEGSAEHVLRVAPELPLPFEWSWSSASGDDRDRYAYKLTALRLG